VVKNIAFIWDKHTQMNHCMRYWESNNQLSVRFIRSVLPLYTAEI